MIAPKLVRLIETHSEQLARSLHERIQNSPRFKDYQKVPPEELKQRTYEIYHNLGEWLLTKTESEIERRYTVIGARRASQGIALSQVVGAILTVKEHLWEFLRREGLIERPVELFQELDLLQVVDQFFDKAVYYAAVGHERASVAQTAAA